MQVDPSEPIQIPLRNRDGVIVGHATVDANETVLAGYRWYRQAGGYAVRIVTQDGRRIAMWLHRAVLGLGPGDPNVDHINGDPLDCRRANLRLADRTQNAQNKTSLSGASRYRGVSWDGARGKWRAQACVGGRNHFLGRYNSEAEAADAASAFRLANMPYTNEDRRVNEEQRR